MKFLELGPSLAIVSLLFLLHILFMPVVLLMAKPDTCFPFDLYDHKQNRVGYANNRDPKNTLFNTEFILYCTEIIYTL